MGSANLWKQSALQRTLAVATPPKVFLEWRNFMTTQSDDISSADTS
jgi:hypothetical protein